MSALTKQFRNIFESYPAFRLPEDLREGLNPSAIVTVTIENVGGLRSGEMFTERRFSFANGRSTLMSEVDRLWP